MVGRPSTPPPLRTDDTDGPPASTANGNSGTGGSVPTQTLTGSVLYVRVHTAGGEFRLVTLTSYELGQGALIRLATEALRQPLGG